MGGKGEVEEVVISNSIGIAKEKVVERVEGLRILRDDIAKGLVFGIDDMRGQYNNYFSLAILTGFFLEEITENRDIREYGNSSGVFVVFFTNQATYDKRGIVSDAHKSLHLFVFDFRG